MSSAGLGEMTERAERPIPGRKEKEVIEIHDFVKHIEEERLPPDSSPSRPPRDPKGSTRISQVRGRLKTLIRRHKHR